MKPATLVLSLLLPGCVTTPYQVDPYNDPRYRMVYPTHAMLFRDAVGSRTVRLFLEEQSRELIKQR